MQIAQMVLSIGQLLALLVLLCCPPWGSLARVDDEPSERGSGMVGAGRSPSQEPVHAHACEQTQVSAYRAKWKGVVFEGQSDLEVLAPSRLNTT